VYDKNPTANNGTATALTVKGSSSVANRSAYLKFDLSGYTAPVSEAILSLPVTLVGNEGAPPRTVQVRKLSDDTWTESGLTWDNRPTSGVLISSFDGDPVGAVIEVDITAYVNEEIAGDKTLSLVLQQATSVNRLVSMSSREGVSPPELLITK
jgi:hyaluronate lyase